MIGHQEKKPYHSRNLGYVEAPEWINYSPPPPVGK